MVLVACLLLTGCSNSRALSFCLMGDAPCGDSEQHCIEIEVPPLDGQYDVVVESETPTEVRVRITWSGEVIRNLAVAQAVIAEVSSPLGARDLFVNGRPVMECGAGR